MADIDQDSIERLASRLAMLASESGEADNAGRAVGSLARRLGLTGGDLKQIFLRGMANGGYTRGAAMPRDEALRISRENVTLRRALEAAETRLGGLNDDFNELRRQNVALREGNDRRRLGGQMAAIGIFSSLAAVLIGTIVVFEGPSFRQADKAPPASQHPAMIQAPTGTTGERDPRHADNLATPRLAQVRPKGAAMRDVPDTSSPVVSTLAAGTRVSVRRLLWNGLVQWAEVEIDGHGEYVATTDVDLP